MIDRNYLLDGNAVFIVSSAKSRKSYTFELITPKDFEPLLPFYFLTLVSEQDFKSFSNLGLLNGFTGLVHHTQASKAIADSLPVQVAKWAIGQVWNGNVLPEGYKIEPAGRCKVCNRIVALADPHDNEKGPICLKHHLENV